MVPGEGSGPNVCRFASSGWQRPNGSYDLFSSPIPTAGTLLQCSGPRSTAWEIRIGQFCVFPRVVGVRRVIGMANSAHPIREVELPRFNIHAGYVGKCRIADPLNRGLDSLGISCERNDKRFTWRKE
jgi:hypothetical protein